MACTADRIKLAFHEEVKNITDITHENIKGSSRYPLQRIPEGPAKAQNANLDSIIYRSATPAPIGYKEKNLDPRALVAGTMTGRGISNTTTIFNTDINNIDENNCHGQCVIDFAQGYRRVPGQKYQLSLRTPTKCARDFDRFDKAQYNYYFREFRNQFTKFGLDNFAENLLNFAIQNAESNMSIVGPNTINFTTGGWQAPPTSGLTIFHLQEMRKRIMHLRRDAGLETSENWLFEIEVVEEDWFDAVMLDQVTRYSYTTAGNVPLARVALDPLYDPEDGIRKRRYHDYGGIRAYFNEEPIKGYFRRIAATGNEFEFVRIFPQYNVEGGEAGIYSVYNPDYHLDQIVVGGITYDVVVVVPYIDRQAFQRFPLVKPHRPESTGVNYDVVVRDGAWLGECNTFDDKWFLAARHEFAVRAEHPELAGFLVYLGRLRPGYVNTRPVRENAAGPQDFAIPQAYDHCGPDACSIANCAVCGQVPNDLLQCVASGSLPVEVTTLVPCGAVSTVFTGTGYNVVFTVERSGSFMSTASVAYATANGTATAATHYTATSGTLTWVAGETTPKTISVPILAGSGDPEDPALTFTLTLSSPTGTTLGCAVATVGIDTTVVV